ncbi:MAG: type II secretion system protein GspK [Planctomycetaceae bacterium]
MKRTQPKYRHRRHGFVLAVVTITIVLLALGAYHYSSTMLVEEQASAMGGRDLIARTAAESAIEFAATRIMERDADDTINLYNDPDTFRGMLLQDSTVPRGRVRCSVIAFDETNTSGGAIRFGLANENAKFNINKLLEIDQSEEDLPEEERLGLAYIAMSNIPYMTDSIVDAILDWLDSDEDRRPGGAESNDYASLAVSYECKNGAMESIDELLKVQGVTPEMFYGEDANHNGLLDEGEDANGDGYFDLGWQAYFTATSRERNITPEGEPKINLNMGEMTKLYDAVEELFGEEAASFVIGYRMAGTEYATEGLPNNPDTGIQDKISRNDIDLTKIPVFRFTSIYELIGGETGDVAMITGGSQTFLSPWSEDANTLLNVFPDLENAFTLSDDAFVEGRVNINQARREVLLTIPAMSETAADAIIAARPSVELESASSNILARRNTAAWILAEGLVDLETLRSLGPYVTTGGDVYRFQVIGHYDEGGPTTRMEAMVDASEYPPQIQFVRDLTELGRGYHPSVLLPTE